MSDLSARMASRVKTNATPVSDVFRSSSDDMQRATVYLPRTTVRALKQAALDTDTSMSKILTHLAEHWLTERNNAKT